MTFEFNPRGVCSRKMIFSIDENHILHDIRIIGGCPGNTVGVSKLCEGRKAEDVVQMLSGVDCGGKGTSCPDQLSKGIAAALAKMTEAK